MTRIVRYTVTTSSLLRAMEEGSCDDLVCVVATSNHYDAQAVAELAQKRGIASSVYVTEFEDVEDPAAPDAFDEVEAAKLYDFLVAHDEPGAEYLFSCDGSVSRSPGMLCAWMRLHNQDDLPLWMDAGNYAPNVLVYRRLLAAGGVHLTPEQLSRRELLKRMAFSRIMYGHATHAMHLNEQQWREVVAGDKSCELRRLDVKRRGVAAGDLIAFEMRGEPDAFVLADVLECRTASSFEDLLCDEDVLSTSGFASSDDALSCLNDIYGESTFPAVAFVLDISEWQRRLSEISRG